MRGEAVARAVQAEGTAWAKAWRLTSPDHTNIPYVCLMTQRSHL